MKYLVVSDIHGSSYYANQIKKIYEKEQPDRIILLGDLYYHGPRNPLTKDYNPKEVADILNSYKDVILCTKGNCDAEVDRAISKFDINDNITIDISGKKFFFTHGDKYNKDCIPKNTDILVYGHFHKGFIEEKDGVVCANCGSISLPKDSTPNSYLTINNGELTLKDINGNIIDSKTY